MNWLRDTPVAHRGLHDADRGIIENSPAAFEASARAGYAIELDVVISADGEAIVFHDATLDRLTKTSGPVKTRSTADLTSIQIEGSQDTIPTLQDVFAQVRGRVPILVEIKNMGRSVGRLEGRIAEIIDTYSGDVAVQSFNPYSMGWFVKNRPTILRGQISQSYKDEGSKRLSMLQRFLLRHLLLSTVSRPNFIAYDCDALPAPAPAIARAMGLPVISWTVKDQVTADRIAPYVDNIAFEGFTPRQSDG